MKMKSAQHASFSSSTRLIFFQVTVFGISHTDGKFLFHVNRRMRNRHSVIVVSLIEGEVIGLGHRGWVEDLVKMKPAEHASHHLIHVTRRHTLEILSTDDQVTYICL